MNYKKEILLNQFEEILINCPDLTYYEVIQLVNEVYEEEYEEEQ